MTTLNQDFQSIADQINQHLKTAAAALKKANDLKDKAEMAALISPYGLIECLGLSEEQVELFREQTALINVRDLEREIQSAGWSTSSSYC
jgi:hypothetical protein